VLARFEVAVVLDAVSEFPLLLRSQKVDAVDLLQIRVERAATLDDELLPLAGDAPRTARDKLRSLLSFRRVAAVS